jgi:predicted helicase
VTSLTNLLRQLDPVDKKLKGTQFEHITKWFLENDPRYRHLVQVWLWDDWPGYWGPDAGIDLVALDRDGNQWATLCKRYTLVRVDISL